MMLRTRNYKYECDQDAHSHSYLKLKRTSLIQVARAGSSDRIGYPTLNHIWLVWSEDPGQERDKSSSSCAQKGKLVLQATAAVSVFERLRRDVMMPP